MIEPAFIRDRRAAGDERRIHDVAVSDDPTNVRSRPPDVVFLEAEDPFAHRVDVDLVPTMSMHGELGLGRGA